MLIVAGKPESGPVDIQLPRSSSLWVANGKVRKVLFSHRGEQTVNTWRTDILQANGDVTVQGKEEILFPVSGSSMRNYEMSLAVPPTLETGKYMSECVRQLMYCLRMRLLTKNNVLTHALFTLKEQQNEVIKVSPTPPPYSIPATYEASLLSTTSVVSCVPQ